MKKILAFSFFPAMTPPRSGGEQRLFNLYRELSRSYEVVLLSSGDLGGDEVQIQHSERFRERRIPKDHLFSQAWADLVEFAGKGDLSGPCVARAGERPGLMHLAYFEEYQRADIIVHDSPFTVLYDIFLGADSKPRIYNAYNCESDLYKKLHPNAISTPIHNIVDQLERKLIKNIDLLMYCGPEDLKGFERLVDGALPDVFFVPNGAVIQINSARTRRDGQISNAVFIGSGHQPNVEAAELIVDTIAPAAPNVNFHIIGGCLSKGQHSANVFSHGTIDDAAKDAVMVKCDVALNPMVSGGGSNLKVFDFFQNGLPVISTSFGMRGLDVKKGIHYVHAEIAEFATTLSRPQFTRHELEKIGAAGRMLAIGPYSWRAISERMVERLSRLTALRPGPIGLRHVLALNDYDSFSSLGGGGTRSRSLYQAVSPSTPVVFVCLSDEASLRIRLELNGIWVLQIPKTAEYYKKSAYYNSQSHISVDDISSYMEATKNTYLTAAYDVLRKSASIVVCEHPYMVSIPHSREDRFVYSSHNCELKLKKMLLQWHPARDELLAAVEEAESIAVETSALVIAVSDEDAQALVSGRPQAAPIAIIRNGAPAPVASLPSDIAKVVERRAENSAVFLGSAHMPNVDAAKFIVRYVAPRCPDVTFHIVGSVCEALGQDLPRNVIAWGRVEDSLKSAILENALIALNPMFSGSGSNVKLADYLGNGLPIVSTTFGTRGYPDAIAPHVWLATEGDFAETINIALKDKAKYTAAQKRARLEVFSRYCSMDTIAEGFNQALVDLERPKKRVLFVTYRYVWPFLGGAETMLSSFLAGLCSSGDFSVDVAAADVSVIENHERFASRYQPAGDCCAITGVPHLRYLRFPVSIAPQASVTGLRRAWQVQPAFERAVYEDIRTTLTRSGLAWGWGYPESSGTQRRALRSAGLHLSKPGKVTIEGSAWHNSVLRVELSDGTVAQHGAVSGQFSFAFCAPAGPVALYFSYELNELEIQPAAAAITLITIDGDLLDLSSATLTTVAHLPAKRAFDVLAAACERVRRPANVNLAAIRGPHSPDLEAYLSSATGEYDLVITHNTVFRTAVAAIEAASSHGVPSVVIPHLHLDDDFYHFPDQVDCLRRATAVLAAPQAACDFLRNQGITNVGYLPAGIDTSESFTDADIAAFKSVHVSDVPFVLILGRKAGAKNYNAIVEAVERLSATHKLHAVLIGPDEDGIVIKSPNVDYLGLQPRNVIRGALQSCVALINMSSSESFGIVLLEAWLAGKPVIANVECAAFHDIAINEHNALLVKIDEIDRSIVRLLIDKKLSLKLSDNGRQTAESYDWKALNRGFQQLCRAIISGDSRSTMRSDTCDPANSFAEKQR